MAIGKRTWRPVPVDCWDWLEDLSPLAQRLWFWLWTGPTSTPHGIVTVRAYHAAGALGTKPSTLLAALAELEQAGRIVSKRASDSRVDLYLVGYLIAQCRIKGAQRQAIKRAIEAVDLGLPTMQAIEDWAIWDSACEEDDASNTAGKRQPKPQQEQDHKQEQKQEQNSKNNRVPPPAVADDTDFPEPDWAAIAATKAAAPLSVWEGKLPAQPAKQPEPEPQPDAQQALTLKPPAKRELTPAQLDAIFAREQMALWVDEWNKIMAAHNVPATLSDHAKLATTLMRSVARLKNEVRPGANPIDLMRWVAATKYADYYAGKKGKKWTLKAWLAADNLGMAFTCYREYHDNHDARRQWYWHTDRTLTEWREAVQEERDRQAKYRQMMEAEAHDAAA